MNSNRPPRSNDGFFGFSSAHLTELHRDARQDRVENVSRKKETGSRAGSRPAWNISAALHHGHFTRMPYAKAAKRAQIQDALVYASLLLIAKRFGYGDALVNRNLRQTLSCERNFRCRKSAKPIILAACI